MILSIDVGTTFLKVAAVDFKGNILFFEKKAVKVDYKGNLKIVNPVEWIKSLKFLINSVPTKILKKIDSVVVSGNGPTLVPVDFNGNPLGSALLWVDNRANNYEKELNDLVGEFVPANFFLGKAYWFKNENKDLYNNCYKFLGCPEYICHYLTGEYHTLLPADGFKRLYWDDSRLEKAGLDRNKFPKYITPFQEYGKIRSNNLIEGISINTPVICGGPDFIMSVLGSGSVSKGIVCDRTGTSEGINFSHNKELIIDGLRTLPHIKRGLFTVSGIIPESGDYLLSGDFKKLLQEYDAIIKRMLESGLDIKEIRIIGGHAGIESLNLKKASLFPFPVKVYPDGADLVGNAVLGSVALGYYPDIDTACLNMVKEEICYNI